MMAKAKQPYIINRIPMDRCHLYGIKSIHALALRLGWPLNKLESLASEKKYAVYPHPKTGRIIEQPNDALQSLHRQFHKYFARVEVPDYLHSVVKGRSYLTNAEAHVGHNSLIKIDIEKFYKKVSQHKIMHFFRDDLKCAPDVSGLLANLICYNQHLPTGSAVSPIISFFAYKGMFDKLESLAIANELRMTCYVDDITMSGTNASINILREARSIIFREGLSAHKDRYFSELSPKVVTGVIVTAFGVSLPSSRWRKINDAANAIKACSTDAERLELYPPLISRLYEATQIEPRCRKLAEYHHKQWRALKQNAAIAAVGRPKTATVPGRGRRARVPARAAP
jgi:hypothetical protein